MTCLRAFVALFFVLFKVNLVCPNAQGTVLVAAKGASLVGRDLGAFYCCPSAAAMGSPTGTTAPTTHGRVAAVVHRRFEKLLRIEQALAFAARLDGCHQGIPWTSNGGLGGLGGLGSGLNQASAQTLTPSICIQL